jgi:hypothetical protein
MKSKNFHYFLFTIIIIGEILRRIFFKHIDIILFGWLSVGIFTTYYISIILLNKDIIVSKRNNSINLEKEYNVFDKNLAIDRMLYFGKYHSKRHLDPDSIVYLGEFINIILSIMLIYFVIYKKNIQNIKNVLFVQIILTITYYLTLDKNELKFDTIDNIFGTLSIGWWAIIPCIILLRNKYYNI